MIGGKNTENSKCYFCNEECEHYPCHEEICDVNCLFRYCPVYAKEIVSYHFLVASYCIHVVSSTPEVS